MVVIGLNVSKDVPQMFHKVPHDQAFLHPFFPLLLSLPWPHTIKCLPELMSLVYDVWDIPGMLWDWPYPC